MNLQQALQLIRKKYLEEIQGTAEGETADRYRNAVARYPVVMATALEVWAAGFVAKNGRT